MSTRRTLARSATMPLLVIGFGAIALVSASLFQGGAERWALVPVLIGALGLIFHWRTAPLGLLASVAIGKVLPIWFFGDFTGGRRGSLAADLMLAAGIVAYLMAQYRLLSMTVRIFPSDGRDNRATRDPASVTPRELPGALLIVAAATLGAFFLWEVTSLIRPRWGATGPSWRVALLVWILSVGLIGLATVIGYWSWRRQSRTEAMLVLRDEFWRQTRGEQRRINRWRAWGRRRAERAGKEMLS